MEDHDNAALFAMDCEERYDYCMNQVAVERELWILVNQQNEFLKLYVEDGEFEYLPIWPDSELAQQHSSATSDLKAKNIALTEFLRKWVTGLTQDGLDIGVFPGDDQTVWFVSPEEFQREIQVLLSRF